MTVWKYPAVDPQRPHMTLSIPKSAVFLTLQPQCGAPMMWWLVNEERIEFERRSFQLVGTGERVPPRSTYRGTYQQGPFVWHVFEED